MTTLTPETLPYEGLSEDWNVQRAYLDGDCWVMALALCERLGLDALVLCDEDSDPVHCFAELEDDIGIDVRGWRVIGEIVEEFFEDGLDHDYRFDRLTADQLRQRVERNYNCSGLAGLPDAQALVEQWLARSST